MTSLEEAILRLAYADPAELAALSNSLRASGLRNVGRDIADCAHDVKATANFIMGKRVSQQVASEMATLVGKRRQIDTSPTVGATADVLLLLHSHEPAIIKNILDNFFDIDNAQDVAANLSRISRAAKFLDVAVKAACCAHNTTSIAESPWVACAAAFSTHPAQAHIWIRTLVETKCKPIEQCMLEVDTVRSDRLADSGP